jgi:hypothetical protein
VHQLKKSELIELHPEHMARYLIYYLACSGPQWLLYGIEELIKKLAHQAFQDSTRTKLKEKLAARGVDISSCGL